MYSHNAKTHKSIKYLRFILDYLNLILSDKKFTNLLLSQSIILVKKFNYYLLQIYIDKKFSKWYYNGDQAIAAIMVA